MRRELKLKATVDSDLSHYSFKRWNRRRFQRGFDRANLHCPTSSCAWRRSAVSAAARRSHAAARCSAAFRSSTSARVCAPSQGLTLVHFSAQLEALRDTSLTLELNLSTFETHPRVNLAYMGDKVSLS